MAIGVESFRELLEGQGYRVTPQRLAIYRAIEDDDSHPSAQEVYERVSQDHPTMSQATVYKTLELFRDLGLVMELGFGDDVNRYDANPHPHINLVCVRCRDIYDLDLHRLTELQQQVASQSDFAIHGARHEFYGVCPDCRSETQAESQIS